MKNLYEILEINKNATDEEINKAYRNLAKKYHPDIAEDRIKEEKKMKEINVAYDILSNIEERKKYDLSIEVQERKVNAKDYRVKKDPEYYYNLRKNIKKQRDYYNTEHTYNQSYTYYSNKSETSYNQRNNNISVNEIKRKIKLLIISFIILLVFYKLDWLMSMEHPGIDVVEEFLDNFKMGMSNVESYTINHENYGNENDIIVLHSLMYKYIAMNSECKIIKSINQGDKLIVQIEIERDDMSVELIAEFLEENNKMPIWDFYKFLNGKTYNKEKTTVFLEVLETNDGWKINFPEEKRIELLGM